MHLYFHQILIKKFVQWRNFDNAIYDNSSYGQTFGNGHDLYIADGCHGNNSSYCNFPYAYCGTRARALSGGTYNFRVDELEVYQINII